MRVLMLSWEYPPNVMGGMGTHMAGLAPALVRAGVEVDVITPQPYGFLDPANLETDLDGFSREVTEEGVVVHRVPLASGGNNVYVQAQSTNQAMQARASTLLTRGHRFDLIHAHDWLVVFAAQALKHQFHLPLIATIHATEQGRARGGTLHTDLQCSIHGAEWWLAYEAWRVIACSHHMASEVQSYFRAPLEKIDIVPNGVNSWHNNGRRPHVDPTDCWPAYVAPDQKIVFAVGRLVYEKGFHLLVEAAPRILSEFPGTQFVIAGRGPEAENLMQQAERMGVADYVHFPGFISNEERNCLYRVASCAVFPSLYEPFGIVALEAMVAGCPVVVAEVGGLREVVRHGKTGITTYPDDAESITWGVLRVLRNPESAASRAEEAQQVVLREFNWDTIAARTIAVYQRVLDERYRISW